MWGAPWVTAAAMATPMAVRGPIRGETAIDLRDNSEVLIEREDVHKRGRGSWAGWGSGSHCYH